MNFFLKFGDNREIIEIYKKISDIMEILKISKILWQNDVSLYFY